MQSVVIAEGVGVEVGDGSDRSGGGTNQDGGRLFGRAGGQGVGVAAWQQE